MKTTTLERCAYASLLTVAGVVGLLLSWTAPAQGIDNSVYDFFFRLHVPAAWPLETEILGIDEQTLNEFGGVGGIRKALARGVEIIAPAHPRALAVDIILPEPNPADDELEIAFRKVPNLILSSDLLDGAKWDDPIPRFRALASGIGQVHADLDRYDAVSRSLPLEKVAGNNRRWALALEAFRVSRGGPVTESPHSLEVGGVTIPVARKEGEAPMMRIRYVSPARGGIPGFSVARLVEHPELAAAFTGKVVFAGVTAQTAMRDRWMTPFSGGLSMAGVEMNANAFETIAQQLFLTDAPDAVVVLFCALSVTAAGLIYGFAGGWRATALAALLLACTHLLPYLTFTRGTVFPYMPGVLCTWLSVVAAASWRHFFVGRKLVETQASRERYQRAMQFVTHEMRTPLTAIQGSSELITRYALPDEKRKQIAGMINTESKRLARMIETFLNVERLSAGQMELKQEHFSAPDLIDDCVARVLPLAERKNIVITSRDVPHVDLSGDRELMEYAIYNLLTNAVKYSPQDTQVIVSGGRNRREVRLSVEDQGIGMDKQEARRVFDRFYRTRKAEATGEAGTGIGLSIVEQIVTQHGGSILVDSTPGKGSRFTLVLPCNGS